jgi:hypothetical protein
MTTKSHRLHRITSPAPWKPLLPPGGKAHDAAWDAVMAVAQSLLRRDYPSVKGRTWFSGASDALLFSYLSIATGDSEWLERAVERLNFTIERAALQFRPELGLYGGVSGLGWIIEHISCLAEDPDDDASGSGDSPDHSDAGPSDVSSDIDQTLVQAMQSAAWREPYDLISGLVGYGIYFLERLPSERAAQGIRKIVDHLEALAERSSGGLTWHTRPDLLPGWQRGLCPTGYYNLGVAHGMPGVIFLFSEAAAAGIERARCLGLLEGAMDWLLANQRKEGSSTRFASWIGDSGERNGARPAWCYGDLGILAVLLQVAERWGNDGWRSFAMGMVDDCLSRPVEPDLDPCLCHGAGGVAHVLNRLRQSTGDERCRTASLRWFDAALAVREPQKGVGGFSSLMMVDPASGNSELEWRPNAEFLDGATGIALALLAAVTPVDPQWDRLMLLSGRSGNYVV